MIHLHSSTRPTRLYYVPTEAALDPEPEGVLSIVGPAGAPIAPWRELGIAKHVSARCSHVGVPLIAAQTIDGGGVLQIAMHVVGSVVALAEIAALRSFPLLAAQTQDSHLLAHFCAVTTLQDCEFDFDHDEFDGRAILRLHGDGGRRMEAGK